SPCRAGLRTYRCAGEASMSTEAVAWVVVLCAVGCNTSAPPPSAATAEAPAPTSTVSGPMALSSASAAPKSSSSSFGTDASSPPANAEITITDPSERDAALDKLVVIIGIQTRNKQPTVNGVDVDGAYALSDKKVVVRGILQKHVIPPQPPGGLPMASRGPG